MDSEGAPVTDEKDRLREQYSRTLDEWVVQVLVRHARQQNMSSEQAAAYLEAQRRYLHGGSLKILMRGVPLDLPPEETRALMDVQFDLAIADINGIDA